MKVLEWLKDFFFGLFDGVINLALELLNGIFGGFGVLLATWLEGQGIVLEYPSNVFDVLNEITLGIGYLLPINALKPIVFWMLAFYIAKIIFAVYSLVASTVIKRVSVKG